MVVKKFKQPLLGQGMVVSEFLGEDKKNNTKLKPCFHIILWFLATITFITLLYD